ncbi:MAG TPA: DinB family protein [Tepidisphaeraceae bacterium]|jgi:hypothetical protein|nr:DinB family protein [Tepidisphaeraceae bacterium]
MNQFDLAADVLARNLEMTKMYLEDMSEAEMFARPCGDANHVAWQFGHLAVAETNMLKSVKPQAAAALPAGFAEKFTKETARLDDPKAFPSKAEIVGAYIKAREASIAWAKTLTPADMDKPTDERMRNFAPTVGHVVSMMPLHTMMHIGQLQVLRRKLGKPVLF